MESELATIVKAAPDRLIGLAPDGTPRLVWDTATLRVPAYDLPHLAAVLDAWCVEEEPPGLRRGYYRLVHGPDGGVQLWLRGVGLLLSREDLRVLTSLVAAAADELCGPMCRQPRTPFGLGYRRLRAPRLGPHRQN
ncbi:MAG: hypothetical protein HGA45_05555 [Chloroflexales bacterium]|nr:hypothetical protein [Chloroflexales bacterium]